MDSMLMHRAVACGAGVPVSPLPMSLPVSQPVSLPGLCPVAVDGPAWQDTSARSTTGTRAVSAPSAANGRKRDAAAIALHDDNTGPPSRGTPV